MLFWMGSSVKKGTTNDEIHEQMHLFSIECIAAFKEYQVLLYSNWPTFCSMFNVHVTNPFNDPFQSIIVVDVAGVLLPTERVKF